MLREIHITNYTIVDQLALTIKKGLSVLSGETGAGKSIIIDAVDLALGARADTNAIRHGEEQCSISACFDISHITPAQHWLQEQAIEHDNEIIIRRVILRDGRSRSTINNQPFPQNAVRELGELLLHIHSQHQHQALLKSQHQQQLVDNYAGNEKRLKLVAAFCENHRKITEQLAELISQQSIREEQLELFNFQLNELQELNLQADEWQNLHAEHQKLHQAKDLISNLNNAIDLTVENDAHSARNLVSQALQQLRHVRHPDKELSASLELLNTAAIYLQEAGDDLVNYRDNLDLSPERLQFIERRLSQIHDIARKHHVSPEELSELQNTLMQKIARLGDLAASIKMLETQQRENLVNYQKIAEQISEQRQAAAKKLNKIITQKMQELGMQGGEFNINLIAQEKQPALCGLEKIEFFVKTNPGQTLGPMNKVVSGGELSRLSLALQVECSQQENIPSIIFDEVDVGVGGQTAEMVGALLRALGEKTQTFCITHLPQVACQGHNHFKVEKHSAENTTKTSIRELAKAERVQELARMLSGSKVSQESLKHAEQMLV